MSATEDLTSALQVLRARGWCQGILEEGPGEGRVCSLGAVAAARGSYVTELPCDCPDCRARVENKGLEYPGPCEAVTFLERAVRLVTDGEHDEVTEFNDASGRTQAEIERIFECAIALSSSQEAATA